MSRGGNCSIGALREALQNALEEALGGKMSWEEATMEDVGRVSLAIQRCLQRLQFVDEPIWLRERKDRP